MASPQIEDGYLRIARELQTALCRSSLGGARRRVFDAIILKTYGWHKKSDAISISQLIEITGLSRRAVIYSLKNLEAGRFIKVTRKEGTSLILEINKNYDEWQPEERGDSYSKQLSRQRASYQKEKNLCTRANTNPCTGANKAAKGVQRMEKIVPIFAPTKETITKKTTKENVATENLCTPLTAEAHELTELLMRRILKNHPSLSLQKPEKQAQAKKEWPLHLDRLIRLDGRSPPEIKEMMDWAMEDDFWSFNILNAKTLREKWDILSAQKQRKLRLGKIHEPTFRNTGKFDHLYETKRVKVGIL